MGDSKEKARLKRKKSRAKNLANTRKMEDKNASNLAKAIQLLSGGTFSRMERAENGSYRLFS